MSALRRFRRWPPLAIGSALLAAFVGLWLLGSALGGEPGGPASSSYATGAEGVAAWASLLGRYGHPVTELRAPLSSARLDPADTVILLEPDALLHSEGVRLLAFVRRGGRLVYGSSEPVRTLPALLPSPPLWSAPSPAGALPAASAGASVAGVEAVSTAGAGQWVQRAGFSAPLESVGGGGALLLERRLGAGELALLADPSPLQNRLLASASNARFALDLAGARSRPAVFVESVHGFGESTGLAAVPTSWWLAFAGLALAGVLSILARGRRLGPAEEPDVDAQPPRGAYAEALSRLLARTRPPEELAAALERLRDERS